MTYIPPPGAPDSDAHHHQHPSANPSHQRSHNGSPPPPPYYHPNAPRRHTFGPTTTNATFFYPPPSSGFGHWGPFASPTSPPTTFGQDMHHAFGPMTILLFLLFPSLRVWIVLWTLVRHIRDPTPSSRCKVPIIFFSAFIFLPSFRFIVLRLLFSFFSLAIIFGQILGIAIGATIVFKVAKRLRRRLSRGPSRIWGGGCCGHQNQQQQQRQQHQRQRGTPSSATVGGETGRKSQGNQDGSQDGCRCPLFSWCRNVMMQPQSCYPRNQQQHRYSADTRRCCASSDAHQQNRVDHPSHHHRQQSPHSKQE